MSSRRCCRSSRSLGSGAGRVSSMRTVWVWWCARHVCANWTSPEWVAGGAVYQAMEQRGRTRLAKRRASRLAAKMVMVERVMSWISLLVESWV